MYCLACPIESSNQAACFVAMVHGALNARFPAEVVCRVEHAADLKAAASTRDVGPSYTRRISFRTFLMIVINS